jgi:hypothetical protein
MSELEYARPRGRTHRLMRFVLLLMQVNAIFVFVWSFVWFWMTIAGIGIELVKTRSFDDDYMYWLNYSVQPLLLATIAWAACGICRRMLS